MFLTAILPETAFISRFALEVGDQLFVAFVKEKDAAWKEYQQAVEQGKTAGRHGGKPSSSSFTGEQWVEIIFSS